MPTISFKIKDAVALVMKAQERAEKHGLRPTGDDIWNGDLYPGGKPLDKNNRTEDGVPEDDYFWPDHSKLDKSKLTLKLELVGDQGVYLISNACMGQGETPSSTGEIAYAKGCNPDIDEDFYENKMTLFGGDDGAISIPVDWVLVSEKNKKRVFSLSLTPKSVKVNL